MSEADSGWFLRHRDGVEHGPFQLADLVTAARAGNVAVDTCVRHGVHTRSQWVFANRVQAIAQAINGEGQSSTAPAPPRTPPQASREVSKEASSNQPSSSPQTQRVAQSQAVPGEQGPPSRASQPRETASKRESAANLSTPIAADEQSALLESSAIRGHRDAAYPVPRTFTGAVQTLFLDFRFKRFITPWIVKLLWAISLVVAILSITKLGYEFFVQPSLTTPATAGESLGWQFGPMNEQPLLLMRMLLFLIMTCLTGIVVLCIRVVCEMIIVVFHSSGDLRELRKLLKQPKS